MSQGSHSFVLTKFKTVSKLFPALKSCFFQTIFHNFSAFFWFSKFAHVSIKYASWFLYLGIINLSRLFIEIPDLLFIYFIFFTKCKTFSRPWNAFNKFKTFFTAFKTSVGTLYVCLRNYIRRNSLSKTPWVQCKLIL